MLQQPDLGTSILLVEQNAARALSASVERLTEPYRGAGVTKVAGIESRGFVFGVPVAERLGVGFVV